MRLPPHVICALSVGLLCWASARSADPTPESDPWVGTYRRFGGYPWQKNEERDSIKITKEGDTYKLSAPYDHWEFKETEKGVLTCRTMGTINLGTAEFPKGDSARVLRAEFCYEMFILYRTVPKNAKTEGGKETERTK